MHTLAVLNTSAMPRPTMVADSGMKDRACESLFDSGHAHLRAKRAAVPRSAHVVNNIGFESQCLINKVMSRA
jgi:hypothetical protein